MLTSQKKSLKKITKHRIQLFGFNAAKALLWLIPKSKRKKAVSSFLVFLGPKTSIHKRIIRNLDLTMPDLAFDRKQEIANEVWANLGIVYCELLDGASLTHPDTGIIKTKNYHVVEKIQKQNRGLILVGAHFGNWEFSVLYAGYLLPNFTGFYRAQNNPYIDEKINKIRASTGATLVAKNDRQGLKTAIQSLKKGGSVGVLMDQHLRSGEILPFLGQPAATMPLAFSLAKTTGAAVVPYRIRRKANGQYECIFDQEVKLPESGNKQTDKRAFLTEINNTISRWILEDPSQWFWFHSRWKKN